MNAQQYKVNSRAEGESPVMTLAEATREGERITREKTGPVVLLREGNQPDLHPHPDNAGVFYLFKILR